MVPSTGCSLRASGFDSHHPCYLQSLHKISGETKLSSGTHFLFFCIVLWWKETLTLLIFALRIYQRDQIGCLLERLVFFYYSNKSILNKNSLIISIGRMDKFFNTGFRIFWQIHQVLTFSPHATIFWTWILLKLLKYKRVHLMYAFMIIFFLQQDISLCLCLHWGFIF